MSAYLYLVCAFTLNAIANILLKVGATRGISLSGGIAAILSQNWQTILGLALFAANVVFYFLALRALPLSVSYPIMVAMSFLIVNAYAFFVLAEPVGPLEIAGYFLIVFGVILVVLRVA